MNDLLYLNIHLNEILSILKIVFITLSITVVITILIIKLTKYRFLFKKLAKSFDVDIQSNDSYDKLVDKIILQKNTERNKFKIPDKIVEYILWNQKEYITYIHFTGKKIIAEEITKQGFKYAENIYKTTQEVVYNVVDLTYKLQLYRPYGSFLMVISIPKHFFELLNKSDNQQISLTENILSEYNPDENLEYTLPSKFIRGYINMENYIISENKSFLKESDIKYYENKITGFVND
ncbi:MAG TPA: hypothetical protein P5132_07005 [Bacteroidales bacterium]|nr:hypothetical protein [Bacteroidales bacterium]